VESSYYSREASFELLKLMKVDWTLKSYIFANVSLEIRHFQLLFYQKNSYDTEKPVHCNLRCNNMQANFCFNSRRPFHSVKRLIFIDSAAAEPWQAIQTIYSRMLSTGFPLY